MIIFMNYDPSHKTKLKPFVRRLSKTLKFKIFFFYIYILSFYYNRHIKQIRYSKYFYITTILNKTVLILEVGVLLLKHLLST